MGKSHHPCQAEPPDAMRRSLLAITCLAAGLTSGALLGMLLLLGDAVSAEPPEHGVAQLSRALALAGK